jgi:hypothetical protein
MAMYHCETDQEGFLVLSGEALLIVEGEERPLRQWDFFHCLAGTRHIIVGAEHGPCVSWPSARVSTRETRAGAVADETALRFHAGVEEETTDSAEAYAQFPRFQPSPYGQGRLPG